MIYLIFGWAEDYIVQWSTQPPTNSEYLAVNVAPELGDVTVEVCNDLMAKEGVQNEKDAMMEIATIPAPEVLRGMFVNVINSPIQGFVMALNAIAEKRA